MYICEGVTDVGWEREKMEDYIICRDLDDETLFCVIADGTGSRENYFRPAEMISGFIVERVAEFFNTGHELFTKDPLFFINFSMHLANAFMGAYQMANEEIFSGYAASVTCCLFDKNKKIYGAHAGNTRLYIIRNGEVNQVTRDHTVAAALLENGDIDDEMYHTHIDRLKLTSGIGVIWNPEIQTFHGSLKKNDVVLMTTDGIHCALRPEYLASLVLNAGNPLDSCKALIDGAKNILNYPDNMAAMVIYDR